MKEKLIPLILVLFLSACARMGSPDGGWYDDDPPYVVSSTPADQSVNVNAKKITILFNDWLKLRGKLGGQNKVPRLSNSREHIDQLLSLNKVSGER